MSPALAGMFQVLLKNNDTIYYTHDSRACNHVEHKNIVPYLTGG